MSDILDLSNYNPDDIPEGEIHPAGTEVRARIARIAKDVDKNNTPYIMPWFEDPENPNIEEWNDYLPLPEAGETDKNNGKRLRRLKAFGEAFDIEIFSGELNLDEQKSKTGWMIVGVGEDQNGDSCNSVKKYVVQGG
jgi:hypothetical protein